MVLIVAVLLLFIFLVKFGNRDVIVEREASFMIKGIEYPKYCVKMAPHYSLNLRNFPDEAKSFFKTDVFNKIVFHPYRKNIFESIYREELILLFYFIKKYALKKIVINSATAFSVSYLTKHMPDLKIYYFNPIGVDIKNVNYFKKFIDCDKFRGYPLFSKIDYRYAKVDYRNMYSSTIFSNKVAAEIHERLKPAVSMHLVMAFCSNENILLPKGDLVFAPYSKMEVNPHFGIESSNYMGLAKLNLQDIFCRIHVFNSCVRNLNHNDEGDYDTYDQYMEKKYLPDDYEREIGKKIQVNLKILSETWPEKIENPKEKLLTPDETPYKYEKAEMNYFGLVKDKKGYKILEITEAEIIADYFSGLNVAFYLEKDERIVAAFKYTGPVYIKEVTQARLDAFKKRPSFPVLKVKSFEDAVNKSDILVLREPFIYKGGLERAEKLFGPELIKLKPVNFWIRATRFTELFIELIHHLFPHNVVNVIGYSEPCVYVINHPPNSEWKEKIDKGDVLINIIG